MTQKQDKVREEFEKIWKENYLPGWSSKRAYERNLVWHFIHQALQAERERVMEEVFNAYQNKVSKRGFEDFMKLSWILRKVLDSLTQTKKR